MQYASLCFVQTPSNTNTTNFSADFRRFCFFPKTSTTASPITFACEGTATMSFLARRSSLNRLSLSCLSFSIILFWTSMPLSSSRKSKKFWIIFYPVLRKPLMAFSFIAVHREKKVTNNQRIRFASHLNRRVNVRSSTTPHPPRG